MKSKRLVSLGSAILLMAVISAFSNGAGIEYKEVKIGNQVWMAENLNVNRFRNGDPIPEVKSTEDWVLAGKNRQPAWCFYKNDSANGAKSGRMYNWYAITDSRGLAPDGWQIPNNEQWMELSEFLGGEREAGKKLKSASGWNENGNGSNESGFNAEPSGGRYANGSFVFLGESVGYWSTTAASSDTAWFRYLTYVDDVNHKYALRKGGGMFVRCVKE